MVKRIQRKRTRGWKSPPGTKYCGRPSKWGNPYRLIGDMIFVDAIERRKILSRWVLFDDFPGKTIEDLLKIYEKYLINEIKSGRLDLSELRQYDYLSCWCPLDRACHVDVLLAYNRKRGNNAKKIIRDG